MPCIFLHSINCIAKERSISAHIPFFIDTPFARIDSNHRKHIVKEFFMKLKNQMFVLSTDEEIVGNYKEMIENKVSNTYLLQISDYGTTKILADKYFGE